VISFTDFFDAALRRYNDVILLPAIRRVSCNDRVCVPVCKPIVMCKRPFCVPAGQCTSTLLRTCSATVELLHQETPNFLASKLWPPNSPDLSPVDYKIWAVMQHRVYHRHIHSVDELKRRLINVWCGLET